MEAIEHPEAYAARLQAAARARTLDGWALPEADFSPQPIRRVGVIGAGVMGSGIAQWCAACGCDVVLRDVNDAVLARGAEVVRGLFDGAVRRGQLAAAEADAGFARLRTTTGWDGFDGCDLVIEAIIENVAAKRALLDELSRVAREDALLATNTSALPLEEIAAGRPEASRLVGLHFFNPVNRMPLVELIVGRATSRPAAEAALAFAHRLRKTPVICRSAPGFVVTRVLFFYLNAACRLWGEGVPTGALDAAMQAWGWPMGPMRLIDEVGLDVTDFIFGEMAHYFPDRFARTAVCGRLLAAGLKGRKNGASGGFYVYAGREAAPNPAVTADCPACDLAADEIARRLMQVMVAEARRCVAEGVVHGEADVDCAMLVGAGFPPARGGLLFDAR
ncbi:MAG: 3-hydroxyacyl-CoA dehydrogenase family protein [Opitutaceae bacterium]|nr:3-hydroxyacyl-CoA dehydrogenase family protein [Opitutaceae bacterium]